MQNWNILDTIAFTLFLDNWLYDCDKDIKSDCTDEEIKRYKEKWETQFLPHLKLDHSGDCTKACAPCIRCQVENLYKQAQRILKQIELTVKI